MMGLVNLREQEEKPKAIIMAGGAGVGKTFVTDKFKKVAKDKGWVVLNPDQYARNPDPEQRLSLAAAASKINKEESRLNWGLDANILERKIRAFYPYPATWFSHKGKRYKVLKAKVSSFEGESGKILQSPLIVGCKKNSLEILEIQAEGKKSQMIYQFLLGNNNFEINSLIKND